MTALSDAVSGSAVATPAPRVRRLDLQALRAIAVIAVVAWHLDPLAMPGGYAGVDVFFVISGFLMTAALLRTDLRGPSLVEFWARRCRRILPAATLVILSTLALGWVLLPASGRPGLATHALWSSASVENWLLARSSTDYLDTLDPASPFQHFWSLAVEEQFYLGWPLVLALAAMIAARAGASRVRVAAGGIAIVIVLSSAWSIWLGVHDAASAYFVTPTRVWELALGGLIAVLPAFRWRRWSRPLGALAFVGVSTALVALPDGLAYPGWVAWWPTLSTALLIWVGSAGSLPFIGRAVRSRPVQFVGDISYSLYLWHWPVIVVLNPYERPSVLLSLDSLLAVVIGIALAVLTWRFVEEPFRRPGPTVPWRSVRGGLLLGCVCLLLAVTVSAGARLVAPSATEPSGYEGAPTEALGARAIPGGGTAADVPPYADATFLPAPDDIAAALPESYSLGCHGDFAERSALACSWGDGGPVVAVVGDSHAAQWLPAVQALGRQEGWRVVAMTKSSCPLTTGAIAFATDGSTYEECSAWNRAVVQAMTMDPPDVVVTSSASYRSAASESARQSARVGDATVAGVAEAWGQLEDLGIEVVVLRDTPQPSFAIGACVANEAQTLSECSFERAPALAAAGAGQLEAMQQEPRIDFVDMNRYICDSERCPAVTAGVVVYRDRGHLTSTYVASLTDAFNRELSKTEARSRLE